eukprot:TRINITY_DN3081_c0_g1_i1.p1 TRINITY_DN3081_c0_g1~~TRINITY_DN3081_c0_g1_i1.p1  ORF type:complete len:278 (-),score=146.64 TRINITY_DN3081_c0_g1_i1:431-1264(-)
MSEISKADLKKEIQEILKDADLDNTSAKKVRLQLQEKLDVDLTERKKEVDQLVMEVIDEQTQDDGEEEEEEDEEEEEEDEAPPPKKKPAPKPKKRAASESGSDAEGVSEEEVPSDGGGSDYEPDEPVKISKGRKSAVTVKKGKFGSDDDGSSGEEWGGAKKGGSKKGRKKKSQDSDDSDYEKPKKKRKSTPGAKNGYTAPVKLSAELADIVGGEEMPRHEVVKRMWAYIKENNLQDPKNKQMIKCDEKLSKVIPTKKFRGFGMTKFLKDHMNVDKKE